MPFDSLPEQSSQLQTLRLFYDRRQRAAALWRTIPNSQFDIRDWTCRSTACALGWLALTRHDGWSLQSHAPAFNNILGADAAEIYFGLGYRSALMCFGCDLHGSMIKDFKDFYHVKARSHITASHVADVVLQQPYVIDVVEFSADQVEAMIADMETVYAV